MMVLPLSVFCFPFVLAVWVLDGCLFLAALRLVCRKIPRARSTRIYRSLQDLTQPAIETVRHWLTRNGTIPVPHWTPWAVTIVGLVVMRSLLARILLAIA